MARTSPWPVQSASLRAYMAARDSLATTTVARERDLPRKPRRHCGNPSSARTPGSEQPGWERGRCALGLLLEAEVDAKGLVEFGDQQWGQ